MTRAQWKRFVRQTLKIATGPKGPARNEAVRLLAVMVLAQQF